MCLLRLKGVLYVHLSIQKCVGCLCAVCACIYCCAWLQVLEASDFLGKVTVSVAGNADGGGVLTAGSPTQLTVKFVCEGTESIASVTVTVFETPTAAVLLCYALLIAANHHNLFDAAKSALLCCCVTLCLPLPTTNQCYTIASHPDGIEIHPEKLFVADPNTTVQQPFFHFQEAVSLPPSPWPTARSQQQQQRQQLYGEPSPACSHQRDASARKERQPNR